MTKAEKIAAILRAEECGQDLQEGEHGLHVCAMDDSGKLYELGSVSASLVYQNPDAARHAISRIKFANILHSDTLQRDASSLVCTHRQHKQGNKMNALDQYIRRHFSANTLKKLAKRGIAIIGTQQIPGDGDMPWANATTAYKVSDNGTGRVWTHSQVLEAA